MKKIIVFESIHFTIKADSLLQVLGLEYQIVTTPREISSDCGMSIETKEEHFAIIHEFLIKNEFKIKVFEL